MSSSPLLDPRGRLRRTEIRLAPRLSSAQLQDACILFYNNTKLDFCHYPEVYPRLKQLLAAQGVTRIVDVRETPRGKDTRALRAFARRLADTGADAAVLGLADIGVTPATTILAMFLEQAGVPSVLLTAGPGINLARGTAYYRAGRLCLCPLDTYQGSTAEEVRAEVDRAFPDILNGLTMDPDQLHERASIDFPVDAVLPTPDGHLPLPDAGGDPAAFAAACAELHIGDGLPLVPPTESALTDMLAWWPGEPDEVMVADCGPAGNDIRVQDIAVNAVMAGCRPQYLPVVVHAFQAMAEPQYNLLQSVTTSHAGGDLVLVSGPIAHELGIHAGQGCLGPGFRANATIGRAINLTVVNTTRAIPGVCDLDCLASPAQFAYCFAEDPALSPWPTINAERYDAETTTVYVLKAEPPHDVIEYLSTRADHLLVTLAGTCTGLGTNNAYIPGNLMLVLTPDHARLFARDGYDKDAIRRYIHEQVANPAERVNGRGIVPVRPPGFDERDPIPVTRSPEDVEVVVAGGRGGHSAVILPWALHSEAVVRPLMTPVGRPARSIQDFRRV